MQRFVIYVVLRGVAFDLTQRTACYFILENLNIICRYSHSSHACRPGQNHVGALSCGDRYPLQSELSGAKRSYADLYLSLQSEVGGHRGRVR